MQESLAQALDAVGASVGEEVRLAGVGWGSGLTIDLGATSPSERPAWHLWIQQAMWRIESSERVLVASEDDDLDVRVRILAGQVLRELRVDPRTMDALFVLSDVCLRTFSEVTEDETDLWLLFTPDGRALTAETGPNWGFELSSTERSVDWQRPARPLSELPHQPLDAWPVDVITSGLVQRVVRGRRLDRIEDEAGVPFTLELDVGRLTIIDAAWRLEHDGRVMVGSGDRDLSGAQVVVGLRVESAEVSAVSRDLTLRLERGFALRTFAQTSDQASRQWSLELGDGQEMVAGLDHVG